MVDIARDAMEGERWRLGTKEYCAVVILDVRNAFNAANWGRIMRALFNMATPPYLVEILNNYFQDRKVIYLTDEGEQEYVAKAGVPQSSLLGRILWNTMYDGVLRLRLPNGTTIVGFADDIAIVSVAKTVREIEEKTNTAIRNVGAWLDEAGLTLAAHKTEAVLISGRKIVEKMIVTFGESRIESKRAIKYLGIIIDDSLSFKEHVKYIGEKASVTQRALARMMPNIGGPDPFKKRIISAIVTSIMLYACSIWSEALSVGTTRRILSLVYRLSAIRRVSGFRTVADEAAKGNTNRYIDG